MKFPNDPNKKRKETWEETAKLLADCMAEKFNISPAEAESMFEKCHRSNPNPRYKGDAPRPIFAAFCNWKDSERTKREFRDSNMNQRDGNNRRQVIVENKYGPRTTVRRNMALAERKKLKQEGRLISAFVAFPAKLMIKESHAPDAKYRLFKDFSNEPVQFDR